VQLLEYAQLFLAWVGMFLPTFTRNVEFDVSHNVDRFAYLQSIVTHKCVRDGSRMGTQIQTRAEKGDDVQTEHSKRSDTSTLSQLESIRNQ